MSRFGDFAAIWFGALFTLKFVVFRFLSAPLSMYTEGLLSIIVSLALAVVLVFYRGVSLPTVVGSE